MLKNGWTKFEKMIATMWVFFPDNAILVNSESQGFKLSFFLKLDSYKIFFKVPCVLVGNKIDCDRRQVSLEDAEKFAKSKKLVHFETSAKQNLNIADVFLHLTRLGLSEKHDTQRPKNDSVNLKSSKKKSKKGCC